MFDNRLEDGLEVKREAADHLQHLVGRDLLFPSLGQLLRQLRDSLFQIHGASYDEIGIGVIPASGLAGD